MTLGRRSAKISAAKTDPAHLAVAFLSTAKMLSLSNGWTSLNGNESFVSDGYLLIPSILFANKNFKNASLANNDVDCVGSSEFFLSKAVSIGFLLLSKDSSI